MEKEINPAPGTPEHEHIERIGHLAGSLLETPHSEQVMVRHFAPFGEGYNLELRATTSRAIDENDMFYDRDDSRYVYLFKEGDCSCTGGPRLSLDLNDARTDSPREPLYHRSDILHALARAELDSVGPNYKELMWDSYFVARAIIEQQPPDMQRLEKAAGLFATLLDDSLTETNRTYLYKFPTGQELGIASVAMEGNMSFVRDWEMEEVQLGVSVRSGGRAVIFEKLQNGLYETYTEVGDEGEILAAVVGEENVERDEDGQILSVDISNNAYALARQAERIAFGLPRVQLRHLELVRMVLEKFVSEP